MNPSDLSDEEWTSLDPLMPPAKPGGKAGPTDRREDMHGLFDVNTGGGQWRMLPPDLPKWQRVYYADNTWRKGG